MTRPHLARAIAALPQFPPPSPVPGPIFTICIVFVAIGAMFVAIVHGAKSMHQPLEGLEANPVSLDPRHLPQYALLTTLRMFAALGFSLLFTFLVAPLAAKSQKAERVIIPALDILQSVPVLGFLTFTVVVFYEPVSREPTRR